MHLGRTALAMKPARRIALHKNRKVVTDSDKLENRGAGDTSPTLLERVRNQNREAWRKLVQLYAPLIHYWCQRCGLQKEDIEDVGQEVFQTLHRRLADFQHDGQPGHFRGFLWGITRNKLGDFGRAAAQRARSAGGSDNYKLLESIPEPDEPELTQERRLLFDQALTLLKSEFEEKTWTAFWKVTVENLPPAEVANLLGMTVNAVYLARSHILKRFREEFAGLVPDNDRPE